MEPHKYQQTLPHPPMEDLIASTVWWQRCLEHLRCRNGKCCGGNSLLSEVEAAMLKASRRFLAASLFVVAATAPSAFTVGRLVISEPLAFSGEPIHESITRFGLNNISVTLSSGATIGFSEGARRFIAASNAYTDSTHMTSAWAHVDSD